MPDSISWNFNAAASAGGAVKSSGKTNADAVLVLRKTIDAGAEDEIALQLETAEKISFLSLTSSVNTGEIEVKAGGDAVKVTGPLVLYGDAVKLFSADLGTLEVKSAAAGPAELSILIGLDVSA